MALDTILATSKALGDETRLGVYRYLTTRAGAVGVADVAEHFALHPNAARAHLARLEQAGLARSSTVRVPGGGRPRRVYEAATTGLAPVFEQAVYKALARLLLDLLARRTGLEAAEVEGFGEQWGREYAAGWEQEGSVEAMTPDYVLAGLVRTLETWGFAAERDGDDAVRITRCPLDDLAEARPDWTCPLVHGVLQGMLGAVCPDTAFSWTRGARSGTGRRCRVDIALKQPSPC